MSIYRSRLRTAQDGFNLIELVIFIVIIAIAVTGVVQIMALTTKFSADPQLRKQALAIAESLLEEVELARFTYCDPTDPSADSVASPASCTIPEVVGREAGNTRPYDNVNDYVDAFGSAKTYNADALGTAFPTGYTATVTISPDATLGPSGGQITPSDTTSANMNLLHITVTVSYQNGANSLVLDGYRSRYAPNSVP